MKKSFKIAHYVNIIALLALVPLIIMGAFLGYNYYTTGQQLREQHIQLAGVVSGEIRSYLDVHHLALETLAQQIRYLNLPPGQITHMQMLQALKSQYPDFEELYLINPEQNISSEVGLIPVAQEEDLNALLKDILSSLQSYKYGSPFLSSLVQLEDGVSPFLIVQVPHSDPELNGYLLARIKTEKMAEILSEHKVYSTGYAVLLDGNYQVVASTGLQEENEVAIAYLKKEVPNNRNSILEYYSTNNSQQEIASYATIGEQGWSLWVAAPYMEVLSPLSSAILISLTFIALGVVVILFIRRILVANITKPLISLSNASQELASGNLAYRVDLPDEYPTEIKFIGSRFNNMAANLEESNKLAKDYSTQLELRVKERTSELLMKNKGLAALYAVASLVTGKDNSVSVMLVSALKKAMSLFGAASGGFILEREGLGKLSYTIKGNLEVDKATEAFVIREIYHSCRTELLSLSPRQRTVILPNTDQVLHMTTIPIPNLLQNLGAMTLTRTRPWKEEELLILHGMCKQLGVVVSNLSLNKYINEENSTLQAVMASIHEGLILYNSKGVITYANEVFREIFHFQDFDIEGLSVQKLKEMNDGKDSDTQVLIDLWENFIKDLRYDTQTITLTRQENTKYYQIYYFPVLATGGFIGFGCLVRDITKDKEVEILKNTILSTVSHELRTPLTTIRGCAESLLREDVEWSAEDKNEFLTAILEESQRLRELIDNIMDMSKIEAGALNLDIQAVDIKRMIKRIIKRFTLRYPEVTFIVEYEEKLPVALIDEGRIDQVLSNLIENGIKYSPQEAEIKIAARYLEKQKMLEVSVKDKGIGISPHYHDEVFSHFYRIKNKMSKNVTGSGVGLSIAKGIIDAHGSSIWFESAVGQGSHFYVTIPCEGYKEE